MWRTGRTVATKQQTFIFMDLVGYTALSAERGDDGAAEVAFLFYDNVRPFLAQHRAEEIKTIGDAMMLRGDDPYLAICLGLRVIDQMEQRGLPPVRVGVHTGTAVCRDGDWYGSGVNVASRLCSAAGGGEVLVSESAQEVAGSLGAVKLGDRQLHWLKNVPEPVAARRAYEQECPEHRRPAGLRGKLARIRAPRPIGLQRPEVIG
jgi:class 3 adenylate cyclase